jgi:hypothetical protein
MNPSVREILKDIKNRPPRELKDIKETEYLLSATEIRKYLAQIEKETIERCIAALPEEKCPACGQIGFENVGFNQAIQQSKDAIQALDKMGRAK